MVGYKWRRIQIVKKRVTVYGMEFYEKNEVLGLKRGLLS